MKIRDNGRLSIAQKRREGLFCPIAGTVYIPSSPQPFGARISNRYQRQMDAVIFLILKSVAEYDRDA